MRLAAGGVLKFDAAERSEEIADSRPKSYFAHAILLQILLAHFNCALGELTRWNL
jgi:hypothetical protein